LLNISVKPKFDFNNNLSISEHFSYTLINTNESITFLSMVYLLFCQERQCLPHQ
jgi:hypothetical protein